MSHKNGNRSRFDRQRREKLHTRARMRALRASLKKSKTASDK